MRSTDAKTKTKNARTNTPIDAYRRHKGTNDDAKYDATMYALMPAKDVIC